MCPVKSMQFFINGWNYDYHFIIKKLANELNGKMLQRKFECLGENTEKYKTSVQIEKEITKIDKDGT